MRFGPPGGSATTVDEPDPDQLRCPVLSPDVLVHPPTDPDAPWIVQRGEHRYIRVGADLAALLRSIDGQRDHRDLVQVLGAPWTEEVVGQTLVSLHRAELVGAAAKRRRSTWFAFSPPLTFQLTLLKPDRLLRRLGPLIRVLATASARLCAVAVVVAGLVALLVQAPALQSALGRPLPLVVLLSVAVASMATTALHEIGHGAVLTYYGGRPSRMGVMLFYLMPSFFCDVSDGWRLSRPQQRVQVALAGIATQLVVAGSTALGAAVLSASGSGGAVRDGMLVLSVSTFVAGLLNLVPFVKLDGYIALMSHLDVSHLRDRAMVDGRRVVARWLFGGRYERELDGLRWAPAYGLACLVFPVYLIGLAAALWLDLLVGLGVAGATLVLAALAYLLYRFGRGASLLVAEARRAGAASWRIGLSCAGVAGAAVVALTTVSVPYTVHGGFVQDRDGLRFVVAEGADLEAVQQGATVVLHRRGLVTRAEVGSATVADDRAREGVAPFSAFVPLSDVEDLPTPVLELPLRTVVLPDERLGSARLQAGDRPLGSWLYASYVEPAFR